MSYIEMYFGTQQIPQNLLDYLDTLGENSYKVSEKNDLTVLKLNKAVVSKIDKRVLEEIHGFNARKRLLT